MGVVMKEDRSKQQRSGDDESATPPRGTPDVRTPRGVHRHGSADGTSDPLWNRQWVHESGYGGRGGVPRSSSDEREAKEHQVHTSEWPEFSSDLARPDRALPDVARGEVENSERATGPADGTR